MTIRLSQLRRIIREAVVTKTLSDTLRGDKSAEEERNAALAAAGIKPPPTPSGGSVPLATPREYPASQPNRSNNKKLMRTNFGNRGAEEERNAALAAAGINAAGLEEDDAALEEVTESIFRAIISRASRRR